MRMACVCTNKLIERLTFDQLQSLQTFLRKTIDTTLSLYIPPSSWKKRWKTRHRVCVSRLENIHPVSVLVGWIFYVRCRLTLLSEQDTALIFRPDDRFQYPVQKRMADYFRLLPPVPLHFVWHHQDMAAAPDTYRFCFCGITQALALSFAGLAWESTLTFQYQTGRN